MCEACDIFGLCLYRRHDASVKPISYVNPMTFGTLRLRIVFDQDQATKSRLFLVLNHCTRIHSGIVMTISTLFYTLVLLFVTLVYIFVEVVQSRFCIKCKFKGDQLLYHFPCCAVSNINGHGRLLKINIHT